MPVMNGIEATATIKASHPDVRGVAFTSSRSNETKTRMKEAGADAQVDTSDLGTLIRVLNDLAQNAFGEPPAE